MTAMAHFLSDFEQVLDCRSPRGSFLEKALVSQSWDRGGMDLD
jgi:hypothetical protein